MKKALFIAVSLLLMFCIAALTFVLYSNHNEKVAFDDLEIKNKQLVSGKQFSAEFKCDLKGKVLSTYDYYIEDGKVYLTLYANADGKTDFVLDSDGYTKIIIVSDTEIKKVVYVCGEKEDNISFNKK